jgi:hypothetical protein
MENHAGLLLLIKFAIAGTIIYFIMKKGDKTRKEVEIVEDMQASVFHTQEIYGEKPMQQEPKLSLYQRIKAQPVALKRFLTLVTFLWVSGLSILFFGESDFNIERASTKNYLIITYLPIIIIYGIYWIMSGIKKGEA